MKLEVSFMVGSHVNLDHQVLAWFVLASDDTIGVSPAGSLVLSRPRVRGVTTYTTTSSIPTILMLETSAESLMIIEVWWIVITQPPHGGS